jgi:NADH-quinone oxidoreductase subunit L
MRRMGGLKKYLPITYWTFVVGTLAIAGFPFFAGFFSKDEILYKTFVGTEHHHASLILWGIGMLTALLTSVYMFRLVFMTFHGTERFASGHAHSTGSGHGPSTGSGHGPSTGSGHGPSTGSGHGHHGAPHEAPMSMAVPLILLAIGSTVAGFVGVPHALGGHNLIEGFLHPSFEAHGPAVAGEAAAAPAEAAHAPAEGGHADDAIRTERMLMAVSVGVALAGFGLALFFWGRRPEVAERLSRSFSGVYKLLLNKYYVDEIYDAVIVQPLKQVSTGALWKGVDAGLIDGSVNGVGALVRGASGTLRQLQTGSVRTYAASLFLGVVMILGWYLWI